MKCPKCHTQLLKEDINVSTDVAFCQKCSNVFKLSDLVSNHVIEENFDLSNPPKGTWLKESVDSIVIGATTRSSMALFVIPFMFVWSGFSLGGIYGTQITSGKFDLASSLFGIPFLLGSIIFWSLGLMLVFGKTELTLTKQGGRIFTGLGLFGISKNFTWNEVNSIQEDYSYGKRSTQTQLSITGTRRLVFGVFLNAARRYFIMNAFRYYRSKLA